MIKDLQEQRARLMNQAQEIYLAKPDAEQRAKADAMLKDSDSIESDIRNLEKIEKYNTEERSRTTPPRPSPEAGNTDNSAELRTKNEKKAFADFIRGGQVDTRYLRSEGVEHRDLGVITTGSITGGSQFVPQGFDAILNVALKSVGGLLPMLGQKKTASGNAMKMATSNDTANVVALLGEEATIVTADPTLAAITSNVDMLSTALKVSIQEVQDSAFDIDQFVREQFAVRYARGVNALVTAGSSTGFIQSIVSSATTGFTSAAPTVVTYSDLVGLYGSLEDAYLQNATWTMNTTTRASLLGQLDTLGRPIFTPNVTTGALDSILGRPVVINQALANVAATTKSVQLGDYSKYMLRTAGDISVMVLKERYIDQGMYGYIFFSRVGGSNLSAGIAPIVNLLQHA